MSWYLTTIQILISFKMSLQKPMKWCFHKLVSCLNRQISNPRHIFQFRGTFAKTTVRRAPKGTETWKKRCLLLLLYCFVAQVKESKVAYVHYFSWRYWFPFNFSLSAYLLLYPGFLTGIEGRKLHFSLICYGCCLFIKTFPV